jgi:hypothetical protein
MSGGRESLVLCPSIVLNTAELLCVGTLFVAACLRLVELKGTTNVFRSTRVFLDLSSTAGPLARSQQLYRAPPKICHRLTDN